MLAVCALAGGYIVYRYLKAKRHLAKYDKGQRSFSVALHARSSQVEMGGVSAADRAADISAAAEVLGEKRA